MGEGQTLRAGCVAQLVGARHAGRCCCRVGDDAHRLGAALARCDAWEGVWVPRIGLEREAERGWGWSLLDGGVVQAGGCPGLVVRGVVVGLCADCELGATAMVARGLAHRGGGQGAPGGDGGGGRGGGEVAIRVGVVLDGRGVVIGGAGRGEEEGARGGQRVAGEGVLLAGRVVGLPAGGSAMAGRHWWRGWPEREFKCVHGYLMAQSGSR